jgi:acyl-CoA synthetase (AMP-forming)/AMP-acid ligase II
VHGRAGGAINRGGFKVLPESVREVLLGHTEVRDAAVVGVADERLGQVPFAVVETTSAVTEDELKQMVRQQLPAHHVPVAIAVVDELPRTPAMKVSIPAVRDLYQRRENR